MTLKEVLDKINFGAQMFNFEYNGRIGNIDPYFSNKENRETFLLYFDHYEVKVYSIKDVADTPFIDGKTLTEAFDGLTGIKWT